MVLLNDGNIEEIEYETYNKQQIKGNIYLAKIVRIEPSLQAAFIDYGADRNGFLPFSEIHQSYYHIPVSDRDKLSADLCSINRPEITQNDLAEEGTDIDVPDDKLFSLDGEIDEIEEEPVAQEKLYNQYKIQDVIKKGQIILVQAQKEARGNKGASFTSFLSLAGKYCVLVPNSEGGNGISRKIANVAERKRLKSIIDEMLPKDSGVSLILRTAGVKRTRYEIKRDYDYLVRLWNKIREITLQSTAPAFIHMEEDIIHKTIRDIYDHNVKEVLVEGNYAFSCAREIMHNMLPNDVNNVVEYKSKVPIFTKFKVEAQLSNLYQPITELPSGGYIVINPTEALISIDVNSGRATSERNIEETAFRTNMEAAKEIARQLKLRDLSGLIVVDFIDMYDSKNRRSVERIFKESLSRDRARIQVGNISTFGLLEMSRQRLRGSFLEVNAKVCDHCSGKGIVRADESNAMLMLRIVEQEICEAKVDIVNLYSHTNSALYLLNNKRDQIKLIEEKYNITLNILSDPNANADSFSMDTIVKSKEEEGAREVQMPLLKSSASLFNEATEELSNTPMVGDNSNKKKKLKKWKDRKARENKSEVEKSAEPEVKKETVEESKAEVPTKAVSKKDTNKKVRPALENESKGEAEKGDDTEATKPMRRKVVRTKAPTSKKKQTDTDK
ncbi:MAG UNVERIFIED_CONTAM: Rne/Rng family ribonuclease [Rickettsiaceae bacterium]